MNLSKVYHNQPVPAHMSYTQRNVLTHRVNAAHWHLPSELIRYILALAWVPPMVSSADSTSTMFTVNNIVHIIVSHGRKQFHIKSTPPGRVIAQVMDQNDIYVAVAETPDISTSRGASETPDSSTRREASGRPSNALYSGHCIGKIRDDSAWIEWRRITLFSGKIMSLSSFYGAVTILIQKPTKQQLWVRQNGRGQIHKVKTGQSIQSVGRVMICDGIAYRIDSMSAVRLEQCVAPRLLRFMNYLPVFICNQQTTGGFGRVQGQDPWMHPTSRPVGCHQDVYRTITGVAIDDIAAFTIEFEYPPGSIKPEELNGPHGSVYATVKGFYRINLNHLNRPSTAGSSSHRHLITWEELGIL